MIVTRKIGNISAHKQHNKQVDWLLLEWYETAKRIMRKHTKAGVEVVIKFMNESQQLTQGDILFEDHKTFIAIEIIPADTIVIQPSSMYEMATVCYEIGNKHLPLFYEEDAVLVPFDMHLFKLLSAQGYAVKKEERRLLQPLKTTVSPHSTAAGGETIFSKIMRMTGSTNEAKGGS